MRIILASKSPRRRELMNALGVDYEVLVSDMEESWSDLLEIEENSKEIAYQKAKDVYNNTQGDRLILSADTIVVKDGEVFGKPKSREEAIDMIRKLQGGKHTVYTKCPHMGCRLIFNEIEKTWDCPCHASRFDIDGKCISGPSNKDISFK